MKNFWKNIFNSKNAILAFKDKQTIRGACTESKRFSTRFTNFDLFSVDEIQKLDELSMYENIILSTQVNNYYKKYDQIKIIRDCIVYTRPNTINHYLRSVTNGFSIYSQYKGYVGYFPMLYKPDYFIEKIDSEIPVIGYYHRPYRNKNYEFFYEFIKELKRPVHLFIMNSGTKPQFKLNNIKKTIFTNNPILFWSNVSHYFYAASEEFIDPWPTTLQEAVNFNKQIIIRKTDRNFNDGIDDILQCIKYHKNLTDYNYDNTSCLLNIVNFDKIYKDPKGYNPENKKFEQYLEEYL